MGQRPALALEEDLAEVRLLRGGQSPSARLVHMGSQPVNVEVRQ